MKQPKREKKNVNVYIEMWCFCLCWWNRFASDCHGLGLCMVDVFEKFVDTGAAT